MKRPLSLKTRQNEEIDVIKAESIRRAIISDDVKILKTLLDTESAKLCFAWDSPFCKQSLRERLWR